jgi:hypothetical protein
MAGMLWAENAPGPASGQAAGRRRHSPTAADKTKGKKGAKNFSAHDKSQLGGQLNGKNGSKMTADTWTKGGIADKAKGGSQTGSSFQKSDSLQKYNSSVGGGGGPKPALPAVQ